MGQQINVNIRMDKDVKEQADKLFNELGFNFTTAINAFVRQSLRERAIPFSIKASVPVDGRAALRTAFQNAQAQSIQNGTDHMTWEEIDEIIAEARREKRRQ
ncbi:MAG: type II toxin-antitoxin system RelB/DinJ family antitoxin [Clostridiales bacterium]|nr:type II toxin-antitoxin system RelB/DinJ family antitoxin [Clostridiales bacterium]